VYVIHVKLQRTSDNEGGIRHCCLRAYAPYLVRWADCCFLRADLTGVIRTLRALEAARLLLWHGGSSPSPLSSTVCWERGVCWTACDSRSDGKERVVVVCVGCDRLGSSWEGAMGVCVCLPSRGPFPIVTSLSLLHFRTAPFSYDENDHCSACFTQY
jgi:hypothetical protein